MQERENEFKKIEKLNKLLIPTNFVKYKKELEDKAKYLRLTKVGNINIEIQKLIIELQKLFLKCFAIKIKQVRTKSEVETLIYEFRYYYLLTFDEEYLMCEIPEIENQLSKTLEVLIFRAKQEGIIGEFSKRPDLEIKIFKAILSIRTISLDDIYVAIIKDKSSGEIYMNIYDEEEFEQKVPLGTENDIQKKELGVKFNKKVKVFY